MIFLFVGFVFQIEVNRKLMFEIAFSNNDYERLVSKMIDILNRFESMKFDGVCSIINYRNLFVLSTKYEKAFNK